MSRNIQIARVHEHANKRWRHAENGDTMFLRQRPEPVARWVIHGAVVHDSSGANQRRAQQLPWTHHPSEIGHPEHRVRCADVEPMLHVLRSLDRESAMGMDRSFWLSRGA